MPHKKNLPRATSSIPKGSVGRGGTRDRYTEPAGVMGGMGKRSPQLIEMWPDVTNQDRDCSLCTKATHQGEFRIKYRSTACFVHRPVENVEGQ